MRAILVLVLTGIALIACSSTPSDGAAGASADASADAFAAANAAGLEGDDARLVGSWSDPVAGYFFNADRTGGNWFKDSCEPYVNWHTEGGRLYLESPNPQHSRSYPYAFKQWVGKEALDLTADGPSSIAGLFTLSSRDPKSRTCADHR